MEDARRFAEALTALGCRFAIDDFGAGFGSFFYLKHLPAGYLKIDGDFVRSPRTRTDELVIEAIVGMARGLGKRTVAEWVGDEETLAMLAAAGVDYAQGYHVGRPFPVSDL
jgi:EAL domain-containing protein (putative c-di-GMP-specific phosphodiesterase class I)